MRGLRFSCTIRIAQYAIASLLVLTVPTTAHAERTLTIGLAGSNPRGDFATGWSDGLGLEGSYRWTYVRSFQTSVSLTFLDHQPRENDDPEVLLGVWTLGLHWTPSLTSTFALDLMFGAQHHTALFHDGFDKHVGNKGYNESDLGWCVGLGVERELSDRWRARVGVKTNTIFTQPERVHYGSVELGLTRVLSP
ncbi:MAG: hypothetical protein KAW17_02260 [Candidatus Eisenbacteria sp.]|nr:hypothetical protein [Candidatus Eisenbacteria bacterium]